MRERLNRPISGRVWIAGTSALVAVAIAANLLSYAFGSPADRLAVRLLIESSEHHFRWERDFACIRLQVWDSLAQSQQDAVRSFLESRDMAVYVGEDQVPDANRIYDGGEPIGYSGGSIHSWEVRWSFLGIVVNARYGSYTGNEGAFGTHGTFVWFFGRWIQVAQGPVIMA